MTGEQLAAMKKAADELCAMPHEEFYALLDKTEPLADARFMAGVAGMDYPEDEDDFDDLLKEIDSMSKNQYFEYHKKSIAMRDNCIFVSADISADTSRGK